MITLKPTDAAWAAGIIDGDGYVGWVGGTWGKVSPMVQLQQCDPQAVQRLSSLTGHSSRVYGTAPKYSLRFFGDEAIELLDQIRPYLTIKAREAWLVMEARAQCPPQWRGAPGSGRKGRAPLSVEEHALREGFRCALQWARRNRSS